MDQIQGKGILMRKVLVALILVIAIVSPVSALVSTGVYVTDTSDVAGLMAQAIKDAVEKIDLAMYSFTRQDLANALIAVKGRGVIIRVVMDYGQSQQTSSKLVPLRASGIAVHTLRGKSGTSAIMHHKFLLVDGNRGVTGSFNWSGAAQTGNHENVLIFASSAWILQYRQAFEALWALPSVN